MIEYTSGDILQCEADALVNTVNCVGVMLVLLTHVTSKRLTGTGVW